MRRPSSTNPQHDPYVIFLDRDLGKKKFPRILAPLRIRIERHDQHFPHNAPDPAWIRQVGQWGWLAFTRNRTILTIEVERDAVMRAGLGLFILIGQMDHAGHAQNLVATWARVMNFRHLHQPPFIAFVHRPDRGQLGVAAGRVEMALTERNWSEMIEARRKSRGG